MKNWELIALLQQQDPNEEVLVTDRATHAWPTSEITGVIRTTFYGRPRGRDHHLPQGRARGLNL